MKYALAQVIKLNRMPVLSIKNGARDEQWIDGM